jgi:hypothetical protein
MSQQLAPQIQEIKFPSRASVAFDLQAFIDAIDAHGLRFIHYRAMVNPIGLVDKDDTRRPDPDSPTASNGMIYTKAGCFKALLISNTKEAKASDAGLVDSSTAQFTPNVFYDCGKRVFLAPYDRLYLEEESVLVTRHEKLEHNPTNIDRPKFPPLEILDCIDAKGQVYLQNADFEINNGLIYWKDRNPGFNTENNKGTIFAIRYLYRPHWYVQRLIHEIRVIQQMDALGERTTTQAPQSAIVQREFVFENEAPNSGTPNAGVLPADGSLPPR